MAERFSLDFEIRRFKNLKETLTWLSVWTSWAEIKNSKTNFLAYAKQLDMGLDDWISQVVV